MLYGDSEINMTGFDPRRFGLYADDGYMKARGFQDYGMTYCTPLPGEELPAGRPSRISPLYETLRRQGGIHTETFGWERPKWFSPDGREEVHSFRRSNVFDVVREECIAVRERAGLLDLSGFAKYEVSGADAGSFLNRICANRMPATTGRIVLAHILSDRGRIKGEVTVTRLADDRYYLLSAAAAELRDLDHLEQGRLDDEKVEITNVSDQIGVLVLAGPRSREVLAKLTDAGLDNPSFPWLSGKEITVAGIVLRALRVNYVGELGWELHPPMDRMEDLYEALFDAGAEFGLANFGLYAVNSLRMEKAYRGWGAELTNEVTLLESDMERFIKFDKGNFTGREATTRQREEGLSMKLVYFEIEAADSDIRGSEPIFDGEHCIGVTTSGAYGHFVQKSLGFGYVDPQHADPGTRFEVFLLGEACAATVLPQPVHDPSNQRLKI
jgi:dimethylglycine dehydrogenase